MKLKDFIQVFNVSIPFYLRIMYHGTGSMQLINSMEQLRASWLDAEVFRLGAMRHTVLGSLVEVEIYVYH